MPKIEVSQKDLCSLIGRKLSVEQLAEDVLYAKGELDEADGDTLKIDIKDTNRPDLWSAEGIAREIRGRYKKSGLPQHNVKSSNFVVNVDPSVGSVRPYTTCAVVRGVKINAAVMSQLLQLQEKVAGTFGRNRKEVAIGVYDLDRIKFPIKYTTTKPDGVSFVPLDFKDKLTPREILERHQKGKEYGHLLAGKNLYPIFIDAAREVLSMPPVINSNYSGRVTEKTKDVFIECSGFEMKFLNTAINVLVAALHERGGTIYGVKVNYGKKTYITPDLTPKKFFANVNYINKTLGMELTGSKLAELLEKALYSAKIIGRKIELFFPAYRQDIMHERDIAEDIAISYGFNEIEPVVPEIITKGSVSKQQILSERLVEAMIGAGFQEILSYTLTNLDNLYAKMNTNGSFIEIEKPTSANWSVFRTWLLPCLLEFLSKNKHVEYPHSIFEIGTCTLIANTETRSKDAIKLAAVISASEVNYELISSRLDALLRNLGIEYMLKKSVHPSFIEGRVAEIIVDKLVIGYIGEIHPQVLQNWTLEKPVVAFEMSLEGIFEMLGK